MKTTFISIYSLLTLLICGNCKSRDDLKSLDTFKQLSGLKNNDDIYIIPGSGCTGCISDIETFAVKNVNNPSMYFLFTKIKSVKLFKSRFGGDFINHKNIILDTANLFVFPTGYNEIYPLQLTYDNDLLRVKKSLKP